MCAKKYRLLKEDKDVNENVDNRVNVHKELEMIDIEIYKSVMVVLLWTSILGVCI